MRSVSNGARTASGNYIRQVSHVERTPSRSTQSEGRILLGLAHAVFLSVGKLQVEHTALSSVHPANNGICVTVLRYFPQCSLIKVN